MEIVEDRHLVEVEEYSLVFDDGHGNGFAFPCESDGAVKELSSAAQENLDRCLAEPWKFKRSNRVVKRVYHYWEYAKGKCKCGNVIELYDQYLGACECPYCGQWYSLSGQELLPPDKWEMEDY